MADSLRILVLFDIDGTLVDCGAASGKGFSKAFHEAFGVPCQIFAPADVAGAWEKFTTSLENHIREHENLAIRTAGDFVQKLERMTDMSCQQLNLAVQREARSATDRLQERHRKLDEDSQQGAKGGARWPPP